MGSGSYCAACIADRRRDLASCRAAVSDRGDYIDLGHAYLCIDIAISIARRCALLGHRLASGSICRLAIRRFIRFHWPAPGRLWRAGRNSRRNRRACLGHGIYRVQRLSAGIMALWSSRDVGIFWYCDSQCRLVADSCDRIHDSSRSDFRFLGLAERIFAMSIVFEQRSIRMGDCSSDPCAATMPK